MVNLPREREISGLHGVRSLFQGAILRLARLYGLSVSVVARLGDEVTVKRLKRRGGRIELLAENPDYPPIVVNGPLFIEGLVVGLESRREGSTKRLDLNVKRKA